MNKTAGKGEPLFKAFIYAALITLAVLIIVPVAWVFLASIKQNSEFYGNPWALPATFYWQNFVDAWNAASMGSYMLNSALVTALSLAIDYGMDPGKTHNLVTGINCVPESAHQEMQATKRRWDKRGGVLGYLIIHS